MASRFIVQSPDVLVFRNDKRIYDGKVSLQLQNDPKKPGSYTLTSLSVNCSVETNPNTATLSFALPTTALSMSRGHFFDSKSPNITWKEMDHIKVYIHTHNPIVNTVEDAARLSRGEDAQDNTEVAPENSGNYMLVFAGVVTSVTTDLSLERMTTAINCSDFLYWLSITKINSRYSFVESFLRGQVNSTDQASLLFNNRFIGSTFKEFLESIIFNPAENQMIALPESDIWTALSASIEQQTFVHYAARAKKMKDSDYTKQANSAGDKATPKSAKAVQKEIAKKLATYGSKSGEGAQSFSSSDFVNTKNQTSKEVSARIASQKLNQSALSLYWDNQFQSFVRENFITFFRGQDYNVVPIPWEGGGSKNNIFSIEGTYATRLDMLREVLDLTLYEFYQTPNGLFILKPPLYNAPPSFMVDSVEIEKISMTRDVGSVLTSVTTEGALVLSGGSATTQVAKAMVIPGSSPYIQGNYTCLFPKTWKPSVADGTTMQLPMAMHDIKDYIYYLQDIKKMYDGKKHQEELIKARQDKLENEKDPDVYKKKQAEIDSDIYSLKGNNGKGGIDNLKIRAELQTGGKDSPVKVDLFRAGEQATMGSDFYSNEGVKRFARCMLFNFFYYNFKQYVGAGMLQSADAFVTFLSIMTTGDSALKALSLSTNCTDKVVHGAFKKVANTLTPYITPPEDISRYESNIIAAQIKLGELWKDYFSSLIIHWNSADSTKKLAAWNATSKSDHIISNLPTSQTVQVDAESILSTKTAISSATVNTKSVDNKKAPAKKKDDADAAQINYPDNVSVPEVEIITDGVYPLTEDLLRTSQGEWNTMEHGQRSTKLTNRLIRYADQAIAFSKFYLYRKNADAEKVSLTLKTLRPDILPGFTLLNKLDMCVYYVNSISFSVQPGGSISTELSLIVRRPPIWMNTKVGIQTYTSEEYVKTCANPYLMNGRDSNGKASPGAKHPEIVVNSEVDNYAQSDLEFFGWELYGPSDSTNIDPNGVFLAPFGGYMAAASNATEEIGSSAKARNPVSVKRLCLVKLEVSGDVITDLKVFTQISGTHGEVPFDYTHPPIFTNNTTRALPLSLDGMADGTFRPNDIKDNGKLVVPESYLFVYSSSPSPVTGARAGEAFSYKMSSASTVKPTDLGNMVRKTLVEKYGYAKDFAMATSEVLKQKQAQAIRSVVQAGVKI